MRTKQIDPDTSSDRLGEIEVKHGLQSSMGVIDDPAAGDASGGNRVVGLARRTAVRSYLVIQQPTGVRN